MTQAQAAVKAATLTAPTPGVVGAIGMTAGQTATSSSTISTVGQVLPTPASLLACQQFLPARGNSKGEGR